MTQRFEGAAAPRRIVFMDDAFAPDDRAAHVPATDRGLLLGDGAFETLRAEGACALQCTAHLRRLEAGLTTLGIARPLVWEQLPGLMTEALLRLGAPRASLRLTITRGDARQGLGTRDAGPPRVLLTATPLEPALEVLPEVLLAETRRPSADMIPTHFKCTSYVPQILARREAEAMGLPEALMRNGAGDVVCATSANLFLLGPDGLRTPPESSGALPGITRAQVLSIAREAGMRVREAAVSVADLEVASSVFLTNSLRGLVEVRGVRQTSGVSLARYGDHARGDLLRLRDALEATLGREARGP